MDLTRFQQRDGNRGGGNGAQHFSGGQRLLAIAHWSLAAAAGNVAVDNIPVEQSGGASGGGGCAPRARFSPVYSFCFLGVFFFFFFFFFFSGVGGGAFQR